MTIIAAASSTHVATVYLTYAASSIGLTYWLARTLFKNGEVFLEDVFVDNPRMAASVNHLLVVGFYLLNLGYAALIMKARGASTSVEAVEVLAWKLGGLLLSLGAMHFFNMYVFYRIRRRSQIALMPPPVAPQMRLQPGPATYWQPHEAEVGQVVR